MLIVVSVSIVHRKQLSKETYDSRSAFHLCGKTGDNFPPDGTVCVEKKVVPLWNQMERFFPTRSMVHECDRAKWFSNIPVISVKMGKEDYV